MTWTVWKSLGLIIVGAELFLLILGIALPVRAFPYVLAIMLVLLVCIFPLAGIDIYQNWPR